MSTRDFTTSFVVEETPAAVFDAINDVRRWWGADVEGDTQPLGAEFTYRHTDMHRSVQEVTAFAPGERIEWLVKDSTLAFVADHDEWTGSRITFEITPTGNGTTEVRFSHLGLNPDQECFDMCSTAWTFYIGSSLRSLIASGTGQPDPLTPTPAE